MLKIGVLGVGHLGKIHLNCIKQIEDYHLVGFYDVDRDLAQSLSLETKIRCFDSVDELIRESDVIDIVTPTNTHFDLAMQCLQAQKHIFIEKPIAAEPDQANALIAEAAKMSCKIQVGHVERYNPAFVAMQKMDLQPMFIEAHRLAPFNPRGTDVSVVLDLMIHDLDILLHIVKSEVVELHASGVSVVSEEADICNARLQFANGCVANLTASRISLKQMRKIRIFQPNAYVSMDFLEKESQIIQLSESPPAEDVVAMELPVNGGTKWLGIEIPEVKPVNAILEELKSFHHSIVNDTEPGVTAQDAADALALAFRIKTKMEEKAPLIKNAL